jgi:hypothetical protein
MNEDGESPPPPPMRHSGPKGKPVPESAGGVAAKLVLIMVIAGVVLMALGGVFGHAMDQVWKYPQGTDAKYDGDNDGAVDSVADAETLDEGQSNFELRRTWDRALENLGTYFYLFGIVILIIGLLVGGIACPALPDMVRLGMVVSVGFLVFFWV